MEVLACAALALPVAWCACHVVERCVGPVVRPGSRALVAGLVVVAFSATAWRMDLPPLSLGAFLVLLAAIVVLGAVDVLTRRLPDVVTAGALAASLVLLSTDAAASGGWGSLVRGLGGGLGYLACLLVVHLWRPDGLGFGDVKLAALLGLHLGWLAGGPAEALGLVASAMAVGAAGAAAVGAVSVVLRQGDGTLPFGPFLGAGTAWVAMGGAGLGL